MMLVMIIALVMMIQKVASIDIILNNESQQELIEDNGISLSLAQKIDHDYNE